MSSRTCDHLTLPLFPLALLAEAPGCEVGFEQVVSTASGPIAQRWVARAPSGVGLPRADDLPLLLGLLALGAADGFATPQVAFVPNDLLAMVGLTNGGRHYRQLQLALARLQAVSIEASRCVYGPGGKWETAAWHLLDEYALRDGRQGQASWIRWGQGFWSSLQRGDLRPFDLRLYLSLRSPLARNLFRLLDLHRAAGSAEVGFSVEELRGRLGLAPVDRPARLMQRLAGAHEQLRAASVIDSVQYQRGGGVRYQLAGRETALVAADLVSRGFRAGTAGDLLLRYGALAVIEHLDALDCGRHRCERVQPFLVAALRERYELREDPDEPGTIAALLAFLPQPVGYDLWRRVRRLAALADDDPSLPLADPAAWPPPCRAAFRYLAARRER